MGLSTVRWRKYLFPGVSGALVGFAAVLCRRLSRRRRASVVQDIRSSEKRILIVTEEQARPYRGREYLSRVSYTCEPSRFKVWRFLHSSGRNDGEAASQRIYHIAPVIEFKSSHGEEAEVVQEEKFYATLHGLIAGRVSPDRIAESSLIEFHKCHVGGSMNGVETGEKVVSRSPVARFEFLD